MPVELKYKDITEKIIGASFEVRDFQKNWIMIKSVKSINPCKSVIQTIYDIVKAHGGELSCSSRVNEGTEFIIKLPVD